MRPAGTDTMQRRALGVTLLELLVAVAILGTVAGLLYGTFSRTLASRDYATGRAEAFAVARAAFDWLERDLQGSFSAGSHPTAGRRFVSVGRADAPTLDADRALLEVTAATALGTAGLYMEGPAGVTAPNMTDQARIVYRLEQDEEAAGQGGAAPAGLALVRYDLRPARLETIEGAARSVIARPIESVRMRFFDGTLWHDDWDSRERGVQHDAAPRLVEIQLTLHSSEGEPLELVSAVALTVTDSDGG